jgi:hypothetical protein
MKKEEWPEITEEHQKNIDKFELREAWKKERCNIDYDRWLENKILQAQWISVNDLIEVITKLIEGMDDYYATLPEGIKLYQDARQIIKELTEK